MGWRTSSSIRKDARQHRAYLRAIYEIEQVMFSAVFYLDPLGVYTPSSRQTPPGCSKNTPRGILATYSAPPDPLAMMGWDRDLMTPSMGSANPPPGPKSWMNAWFSV